VCVCPAIFKLLFQTFKNSNFCGLNMALPVVGQMNERQIALLEKQQYRMVGNHSAVKVCGWTKNMLRGRGGCYKYKFYGIRSHQCMQMTTSMFCANRCSFCWRGEKAPVSKDWYGPVDAPEDIIKESVRRHLDLLQGFKGGDGSKHLLQQMGDVRHVALSLTGEPITYPLMNEITKQFHSRGISTFLVTNAQFPEAVEKLECVTQLYISVDAPSKGQLKEIDRPLFKDYYERLLRSLDAMALKRYRTCVRLTMIKGLNDDNLDGYVLLIKRGDPDFIEVKGYMHVGASQKFLKRENMPLHEEVVVFSKELAKKLEGYEIVSEHEASRVVCFKKKGVKQYIDFGSFFKFVAEGNVPAVNEYSSEKMCGN
jgi:tRNA wybutosine-synthesizing protein 1